MRMFGMRAMIVGIAIAGVLAGPIPSAAAENQSDAATVTPMALNRCGSNYELLSIWPLPFPSGINYGNIYLYYNRGNGYKCVFTEKNVARGIRTYTSAFICRASDGACQIDGDEYLYYAGPVYIYARGQCVKWGGGVSHTDGSRVYREIGWSYCS